jgi:hypothetical protein
MRKLNLNAIRIDGGTQPRERINMEVVGDYAEAVKVGIEFPPVIVFHDGAEYWLADGFHRWHAHKQAEKASILADVRAGSLDDAKLFASGANGDHGLRRSNADKRLAVEMALGVRADWSDSRLAKHVGVSHPFVAEVRRSILKPLQDTPAVRTVERAGKTYQQDTSRIGKARVESESNPPPAPKATANPKREIAPPPPADDDQMAEAQHTITDLAEENEKLRDKLAVESLMDSEEAKTQTAETIRELRALVKTLEAENAALKVSRDTYQREASEAKKSAIYWRRQAEKSAKDAA